MKSDTLCFSAKDLMNFARFVLDGHEPNMPLSHAFGHWYEGPDCDRKTFETTSFNEHLQMKREDSKPKTERRE